MSNQNTPPAPRVPVAPRVDRATALRRPCEGCGAEAGQECMPLSTCNEQ